VEETVQSELVSEVEEGAWELRHIPGRLWMIAEAEESYFGLEFARILVLPLASFSCYLNIKLLNAFLTSAGLAGSEFTAYKKRRFDLSIRSCS
jgi:hypothetical protein